MTQISPEYILFVKRKALWIYHFCCTACPAPGVWGVTSNPLSSDSQLGVIVPCRDIWQFLETFLIVTLGIGATGIT